MTAGRRVLLSILLCLALFPAGALGAAHVRVVNGRPFAAPPYLGFVVIGTNSSDEVFTCGGTAIRPNVLLTAAHCLTDQKHYRLLVGGHGAIVFGEDDPWN